MTPNGGESAESETADLTVEAVIDILQFERARRAIPIMANLPVNEPVPLPELASMVAEEAPADGEDTRPPERIQYAFLYQTLLTRLDRYGAAELRTNEEDAVEVIPNDGVRMLAEILTAIETHLDSSLKSHM